MPGADRLVPTYLVKLNNKRLPPEMSADLQAVVIEEHLDCPAMFLLTFSRAKQCWCGHKDLSIGSSVIIELGYLNGTRQVIDGEITGDGAEYSFDEPAYTTVKGYDRLHRLARRHMTRTFRDMKDWQIAQQIAEETYLAADIQDKAGEPHEYVVQNGLQDLAFLLERARRAGREIGVNGKNLFWRKPTDDLEPVAVLEYGKSLRGFSVNVTGMGEKSEVIVRGMAPATRQAIVWREESRADMPFGRAREIVIDNSIKSVAEAENLARAVLREMQMEYMNAQGSCLGNPDIHVGQTLMIKGVGDKVAGKYYIVWVEHELTGGEGYITRFKLKKPKPPSDKKKSKSATGDDAASAAASSVAASTGSREDQKPSLANAQWSQTEVKRGDKLKLTATTQNIPDNTEIAFVVSFKAKDNQTPVVLRMPAEVKNNKLEADWKFKERPEGDKAPPGRYSTYYFEVEYQDQKAKSGELIFKEPINIFVLVSGTTDPGNVDENSRAKSHNSPSLMDSWGMRLAKEDGTPYPRSDNSYWGKATQMLDKLDELKNEYYDLHIFRDFSWSGDNGIAARKEAGKKLADLLPQYYPKFKDQDVSLHLIGHSHGGNVVHEFTQTIKSGNWPQYWKIKSITYLSTPFFKHNHPLDQGKFHSGCKVINVFNKYDLTQRVLADFSLHSLNGILPMLEEQGISKLAKKITGTDWPAVVKELSVAMAVAIGSTTIITPTLIVVNTLAGFPLVNGNALYDKCLELFKDIQKMIRSISQMTGKLNEKIINGRPIISRDLMSGINDKFISLSGTLEPVVASFVQRQQNKQFTLLHFIQDLDIGEFVRSLTGFLEITPHSLEGELSGYAYEIIAEQIDEFDNTINTPAKQMSGNESKIVSVEISKIDEYYGQRDKEFDEFVGYLEKIEQNCGKKPGKKDLLDMVFTLLAQIEFVHDVLPGVIKWTSGILDGISKIVPNIKHDPGKEEKAKQSFKDGLQNIVKLLRNYQSVFHDRAFGRGIALEHDISKRGSLKYLFTDSHNLGRDVLFEQTYRDEEKDEVCKAWEKLIDTPKKKDIEE